MIRIVPFTFNPFQENTYVLHDGREAVLVDPGCWNSGEEHELESYFEENDLTPVKLVLTHAHVDHVMGCAWAGKRYGLRPWMHSEGEELLKRAPAQASIYGLHCEAAPATAGHLGEGDVVMLGNARMEVLFVPGHAPGHIVLHLPAEKALIAGDVLFHRSIGRTDLPGGDLGLLLTGISTKLLPLDDDVVVHSGHGPTTTIGEERRHNPFLKQLRER